MTMLLLWRQPGPPILTQWRGPGGGIAPLAAVATPAAIPTLIGPPGVSGPTGLRGPEGPPFDFSAALIDGGTFN